MKPSFQSGKSGCVSGLGRLICRFAAIHVPSYPKSPVSCLMPACFSRNRFLTTPRFPSAPTNQEHRNDCVSPASSAYMTFKPLTKSSQESTSQPHRIWQYSDSLTLSRNAFSVGALVSNLYQKGRQHMHTKSWLNVEVSFRNNLIAVILKPRNNEKWLVLERGLVKIGCLDLMCNDGL